MFDVVNIYTGFIMNTFSSEQEAKEYIKTLRYEENYKAIERKPVKYSDNTDWISEEWKYGARAFQ